MPFYHATYIDRVPSILKQGLRPSHERNFPDAEPGVYLTTEPAIAVLMMIEHYCDMDESTPITPPAQLERIRVIVIDDSRVRTGRLRPDPQVPDFYRDRIFVYDGVIDVAGLPVLPISVFEAEWHSETERPVLAGHL